MKSFLLRLLRLLYGFRAYNTGALETPGPVLLVSNHVSWWDWALIGVCLADDWRFVTSSQTAERSWIHKRIMINRRTFPVDMNSPYAVKHMAEYLQGGGRLVLFPEGRLSRTGSLMKLFEGTGFLLAKTHAKVITAYIRNARHLPFSPNPSGRKWFPRLSVHFSSPLDPPVLPRVPHAEVRGRLVAGLRDQMAAQQFVTEMKFGPSTLPQAIADAARRKPSRVVLQDVTMKALSYRRLFTAANLLSEQWPSAIASDAKRVGILLPNVNAFAATLLSLWAAGKVPAILNYSSGPAGVVACARIANIGQIITSRAFLQQVKFDLAPFEQAGIKMLFLEDVRAGMTSSRKFAAALRVFLAPIFGDYSSLLVAAPAANAEDTAVVLFTSGSEGAPKGVELTHRNLLANIRQMLAMADLLESDRFFNALPLFHSFGLTIGLLLPLVQGIYVFLYVSPLHYRVVPAAFYNLDCTVLFGTNTFLAGYARKAHPYDFRALRYVFGGGEKLQESTVTLWMRKFGVRILEGYGATECGPCVTVNPPIHPRHGSAGQFLPGIQYRLEPVSGISENGANHGDAVAGPFESDNGHSGLRAGRLFVRGPNVMRGYVNPEANAFFQSLEGWYDTGDIARVDDEGFVFILGRLKRFAKISGEMVSLTAVEEALSEAFPQYGTHFAIAVIARPDEAKGEKLVAVTNEAKLELDEVRDALRARGFGNLAVPREIKRVHELPRLGSGKINHRELEKLFTPSAG